MINNMSEVLEKFDAIKDHKPRAAKKLNELGDILASAYLLDADTANDMWQYIINLNIADDITYSKFYIAQVFNKLIDRLKPEEATTFLSMTPERVQLMIVYGYDGGTLWRCLDILIKGYVISGDIDNALICLGYFYDKFGGINSGNHEIINVAKNASRICAEMIKADKNVDEAVELLNEMGNSDCYDVNVSVALVKALNNIETEYNFDELFDFAKDERLPVEFFELLWIAKDNYDQEQLREKWVDYVENCEENEIRPYGYIHEDCEDYSESKLKFYVDLEKNTEELLSYYFGRASLYSVEKGVIWSWIEEGKWDIFVRYVGQVVMNTSEEQFHYSDIQRTLNEYMSACFQSDSFYTGDGYGRYYKDLMKTRKESFADALSKISAMTVGCEAHESFHEFIKEFIQKLNGNLDALKGAGFADEVEVRSAEERLKDYVHDFLQTGKIVHESGTKYSLIERALHDELYNRDSDSNTIELKIDLTKIIANSLGVDIDDDDEEEEVEEIDKSLEQNYRLACDDEIAEFYFMHCPREYHKRTDLLSACIRKNDINRAIELIDMMAETKGNEGYEELNGWGRQNMLTLLYLIKEYEYDKDDEWDSKKITDEMRKIAKELVYRMLPHLSEKSREEIRKDLYKIDKNHDDSDEYITQLLEDAVVYTTFPKPRGKGGAPNINRMSSQFMDCFERLSKMGRLDVVVEIMSKFASVANVLKPVRYSTWMSTMARELKPGEMIEIFRGNKGIFEAWLDMDDLRDWDIKRVAEGIADGCSREEFIEFRNLVISRKGKIDGLNACFKVPSENTETQMLLEGETVSINLDFVEVMSYGRSGNVSNVEINLISTAKTYKLDSVRLIKCLVNGIETTNCGFICEMDEEPTIGYNIFRVGEESDDTLTIYSDFFDENQISEVTKIELQFVVMDDDTNVIEAVTEAIIEFDDITGEYRVTKQAESKCCNVDVEEEDDDGMEINIDLASILRKALLSDDESSDEDEEDNEPETIVMDSDDFSDITIYEDEQGVLIDFCGIEFDEDEESITLSIWCRNYSNEKRKLWLDNLKIDGEEHGTIKSLGIIDVDDTDYCYYGITDINYTSINTIDFDIEVDDTDNNELGRTRCVSLGVDTDEETFRVRITGSASYPDIEEVVDDDNDCGDDFEDISIYDKDDVQVDFCGIEFDEYEESITLSIWCNNASDEEKNFWINNVKVNGVLHSSIEKLGKLDEYESDYFEFVIENVDDIDYEEIRAIEFIVEVDDEYDDELGRTESVSLAVEPDEEKFSIKKASYLNSNDEEEIGLNDEDEVLSQIDAQLKFLVHSNNQLDPEDDGQDDIVDSLQDQINKLLGK